MTESRPIYTPVLQEVLTRDEKRAKQKQELTKLVVHAGNQQHLASMLGVPITTVQGWVLRGRISKPGAFKIDHHPSLSLEFNSDELLGRI